MTKKIVLLICCVLSIVNCINICGNRCLECDSTGICISCIDGMYLLNGVCYFCPDGQYFDKTVNSCLNCGTNCNGLCSYRTNCFKCSGSQSFSLLQMKCVDSCSTGEVTIQSDDIHGLKVCRSLNYFVHPSSESILELGTRENPYKNINLSCFNFIDASSQSVSIRLSLGDAHILAFGTVGIINQYNATIQPFNEIATVSTNLSYSSSSRSTILFQDYDIPYTSTTTMFNLLSNFSMNQSVINSLTYDVQKLIKLPQIGFFIANSAVLFKNIRFEDDYMYIPNQKAIWFAPAKLESKVFNLTNVDIKCTSTILSCSDPIGFVAKNVNIIDYINLESGFSFVTQCNYIGATTVGSISIDSVHFTKESADLGQYVTGSLIDIQSPFNISITNSNFVLQNSIQEGFDVIVIKDNGVCSPDDSVVQNIVFVNNTLTLDTSTQDVFINMVISFTNSNKRTKYITISNNTFHNIVGASVSILEINYYSSGTVLLTNNTFRNCSTAANMLAINANDNITISGLKFDSCIITSSGLATLGTAANIGVNILTVIGTSYTSALHSASLIELSTSTDGTLTCNGFSFSNNSININAIKIDSTVGLLSMQNSLFANEMVFTSDPYITIVDIYDANIFNVSFTNMYSYTTDYETPLLVSFGNIQINKAGNIILDRIKIRNSCLGFIAIDSISGSDTYAKNVIFKNINITDCVFTTRNELISIGPILTSSQFSVSMTNVVFNNLTFENYSKVIHINLQSGTPFVIVNCSFTNIYGGSIVLESVSTSSGANKTNLVVQNIIVHDNDFATSTLFVLNNYCILNVTDCTMKRNSGYFYGTIASILGDSSSAYFNNCNFNNNNGVNGGLFYIASQSSISLSNCLLFSNFAINAAVAYIENLGSMYINNCDISFNMAMFAGIIGILDSVTPTTLTNSKIYSNTVVSYSTMIADIDNSNVCIHLCFASKGYINYLLEDKSVMNRIAIYTLIDITSGHISISNSSFYDMDSMSIVNCYNGKVNISEVEIKNLKLKSNLILLTSAICTIDNCLVDNITQYLDYETVIFEVQFYSNIVMTNIILQNIKVPIIISDISTFKIYGANIYNVSCSQSMIYVISSTSVAINSLNVSNSISTSALSLITIHNSEIDEISDSYFSQNQYYTFVFMHSNMTVFKNNTLNGISKGIYFKENSNAIISNCTFSNFVQNVESGGIYKSEINTDGSAIKIDSSNISVDSCTFNNNTAVYGGAVYINCNYLKTCTNTIANSNFTNNVALTKGGAIVYSSYKPLLVNNYFYNNTAPFRPNIGNYIVKVMMVLGNGTLADISSLDNVCSGIQIDTPITFAVINSEGKIDNSENQNAIRILPISDNTSVRGQTTVLLNYGTATFKSTIFVGAPGLSNVSFSVMTSAINYNAMEYINAQYSKVQNITVSFRWCKPGEYQYQNECIVCGIGSYSVIWNETQCHSCPNNAACEGASISLNSGYWRMDANSTDIVECPNQNACLGGYNQNSTYPVYCADGYQGLLCNECIQTGDQKYERISDNQCSKCPDPTLNLIRIVGFGVLILVFLVIMILVNIQKKEDSNMSVLMRIMTNYLQMIAAALAFNLQFPNYLYDAFSSVKQAGNSSGVFLSFDCFLMTTKATEVFNNVSYLKVMCLGLIPIIFLSICISVLRVVFISNSDKFRRWTCITVITVLFVLQPSLTQYCLKVFKCVSIGNGISKVEMDIQTDCWSSIHLKWLFCIAIPMVVVYVIGAPLLAFTVLYKNRHSLDKPETIKYILLLYQGLRHECYYWELINTIRKCSLLGLQVFIPDRYETVKALVGVLILFICALLQARLSPFKIKLI